MAKKKQDSAQTRSTSAAEHDAASKHVGKIEIGGEGYAPGDAVTIDGGEFTAEGVVHLPASGTSGVAEGTYPVVYEMQGKRKAYRAVVDGRLYPIRQYGTEHQVIAKQRESGKAGDKAARTPPAQRARSAEEGLSLSVAAAAVLAEYLTLEPGARDQGDVVSSLVVTHLGPEVERLKAAQAAIAKLPRDLLIALANATEEKRLELMAALLK